ncbi:hypothetical protein GCM10010172_72080 [Paractinoplanes ferrugineus]|uniref:Uncharacterized protein n=1 Tax=Paractinoplanes ferrugineus TaxID=113564 RepID=A0A919J8V7_9ACTN|nr:hypothetical protein Afe05nite_72570 [Actinoplanes ferrugineus]
MLPLVLVKPKRTRERIQDGRTRIAVAPLLKTHVVVDAHPGHRRKLLPPEPRRLPPPTPSRKPDVPGPDPRPPTPQKLPKLIHPLEPSPPRASPTLHHSLAPPTRCLRLAATVTLRCLPARPPACLRLAVTMTMQWPPCAFAQLRPGAVPTAAESVAVSVFQLDGF